MVPLPGFPRPARRLPLRRAGVVPRPGRAGRPGGPGGGGWGVGVAGRGVGGVVGGGPGGPRGGGGRPVRPVRVLVRPVRLLVVLWRANRGIPGRSVLQPARRFVRPLLTRRRAVRLVRRTLLTGPPLRTSTRLIPRLARR